MFSGVTKENIDLKLVNFVSIIYAATLTKAVGLQRTSLNLILSIF